MPLYLGANKFTGGYYNGQRINGYLYNDKLFNYATNVRVNYSTGGSTTLSNVPLGPIDRNTLTNRYGLSGPGGYYYLNDNATYNITENCTITVNVTYNPPPPPTPTYSVTINLEGDGANNLGDQANDVQNYQTVSGVPAGNYSVNNLNMYGLSLPQYIDCGDGISDAPIYDNLNGTFNVSGDRAIGVLIHPADR